MTLCPFNFELDLWIFIFLFFFFENIAEYPVSFTT